MQYVIRVSGDVANKQNKAYVIDAHSEEDAQKIAIQNFSDEFSTSGDIVYSKPDRRTYKSIIAFIFMLIPILLSLINWKNRHDTISISPDYISTLYGVLIYAAFIVRFKGVQRTVSSWIDILFCVFNILLFATFIKTILVTKTINILGLTEINISTNVLLPVAIVLSWLGLKVISLVCMAVITIIALFNITALNVAMGSIFGPLYVICSFIGIMMYLSVEPAFIESVHQFGAVVSKSVNYLNRDISIAQTNIKNAKTNINKKISKTKKNN